MTATFADFDIDLPANAHGTNVHTKCPKCSHTHSPANRHRKDLSVNVTEGVWLCHRSECGWTGTLNKSTFDPYRAKVKTYVPPKPLTPAAKSDMQQVYDWFKDQRGISQATVDKAGINATRGKSGELWMAFPYYRDGEHVHTTYRAVATKKFFQSTGSERVYYGLDNITPDITTVTVVEGQLDLLAFHEAGITNVLSVPNGAGTGATQFDYHDSAVPLFERMTRVYIATDNDEPGRALAKELSRRIGPDKCSIIHWPDDIKDANDALKLHGPEAIKSAIRHARPWPTEGITYGADLLQRTIDLYHRGADPGVTLDLPKLDEICRFRLGSLVVLTGHSTHGKSTWLDHIISRMAQIQGWKIGIFSPENAPEEEHYSFLLEIKEKRPFEKRLGNALKEQDILNTAWYMDEHFSWITSRETDVDTIIMKAEAMVKQKGINVLVIDPWNHVDKGNFSGLNETQFTERALTKIDHFASSQNVLTIICAHPTKIERNQDGTEKVPQLDNINGSNHFRGFADYGISIWRDLRPDMYTEPSQCHIIKIRKKATGRMGMVPFHIHFPTRTLTEA